MQVNEFYQPFYTLNCSLLHGQALPDLPNFRINA